MSSIDDTLHDVYVPTKTEPAPRAPSYRLEGIHFRFERGMTQRHLTQSAGDVHYVGAQGEPQVYRVPERVHLLPAGDIVLFWHPLAPHVFKASAVGPDATQLPRGAIAVLSVVAGQVTTFCGGGLVSSAAGALGPKGPVLMSRENPGGWKLEDLLHTLYVELEAKTAKIEGDERPVAQRTTQRNLRIMDLLQSAEGIQLDSVADLAGLAPDPGPLGVPRIGVGAQPAA